MPRQEFTRAVQAQIIKRATRDGKVYCECCKLPTKRFHVDHIIADALRVDKSKALTADDGQLLCAGSRESCHGRKTAEQDVPAIAEAVRREQSSLGAKRDSRPIPHRPKPEKTQRKPARGMPALMRRGFQNAGDVK